MSLLPKIESLSKLSKNAQIKQTLNATKERRSLKRCRCIELKVQKNKLNKIQSKHLFMLFVEAKWIYNHLLSDLKQYANDGYVKALKTVDVKRQDETITREICYLSSQMKQSIPKQLKNNLTGLKALKKNGFKVGKLKYKSEYNSIDLKQYKNTYTLDFKKSLLGIQGLKKPLKVNGLNQIERLKENYSDLEIANSRLIKKGEDYFLKITLYHTDVKKIKEIIGIDMGIKEQITLSNGLGFSYGIKESKRIKKIQRKMSKKKGANKNEHKSKNFYKLLAELKKGHEKQNNIRKNIQNQIFHIVDSYQYIAMQDEMIKQWHHVKRFGKKIQYSGIGAIKSKVKNLESSRIDIVDKFIPTTKACCICGTQKDYVSLGERIYDCPTCKNSVSRDLASAFNMIHFSKFSAEHRKAMPLERASSAFNKLLNVAYLDVRLHSLNEEAHRFIYE